MTPFHLPSIRPSVTSPAHPASPWPSLRFITVLSLPGKPPGSHGELIVSILILSHIFDSTCKCGHHVSLWRIQNQRVSARRPSDTSNHCRSRTSAPCLIATC